MQGWNRERELIYEQKRYELHNDPFLDRAWGAHQDRFAQKGAHPESVSSLRSRRSVSSFMSIRDMSSKMIQIWTGHEEFTKRDLLKKELTQRAWAPLWAEEMWDLLTWELMSRRKSYQRERGGAHDSEKEVSESVLLTKELMRRLTEKEVSWEREIERDR